MFNTGAFNTEPFNSGAGVANLVYRDALVATDSGAVATRGVLATDTITASDSYALTKLGLGIFTDTITASDSGSALRHDSVTASDTLVATDLGSALRVAGGADSITASDSASVARTAPVLADAITASDSASAFVSRFVFASDTLTATDLGSALLLAGLAPLLTDALRATDFGEAVARRLAFAINAETGAVSSYAWAIEADSAVELDGALFVAALDGLYALDATDDPAGAVSWHWDTGLSALGSDRLKRLTDINLQGRSDGTVQVETYQTRAGVQTGFRYQRPALTRSAYRDGVIKLGRGPCSVYWGLRVQGSGPAEFDQTTLAVQPLSRRR